MREPLYESVEALQANLDILQHRYNAEWPVSATEASAGDLSNQINHALAKKVKVTHNKIGR